MKLPRVICLTPIKNEAWILERFLKCASLWADHIIVADQGSRDDSREIASNFPKVRLVTNPNQDYDERQRQRLLIDVARTLPEPRFLIALDVDEFLTPNVLHSVEWKTVLSSRPGTVVKFPCVQLCPDMQRFWETPPAPLGYLDDGREHNGQAIHSIRIPAPPEAPELVLKEIFCMHLQFTDWDRMRSKHRWYQCWEHLTYPSRRPVRIFRKYNYMYALSESKFRNTPDWWLSSYVTLGVNLRTRKNEKYYHYDLDVLAMMNQHGAQHFNKIAIWDVDWVEAAQHFGYSDSQRFADPRSAPERFLHWLLFKTQGSSDKFAVRVMEKALKPLGW